MHILIENISELVENAKNITIAIKYDVTCLRSISIFIVDWLILKVNLADGTVSRQILWPSCHLFQISTYKHDWK